MLHKKNSGVKGNAGMAAMGEQSGVQPSVHFLLLIKRTTN